MFLVFSIHIKAQVLNVVEMTQEQNQWCWAGVSSCILQYYCTTTAQCNIAEYTRTVATWHNFGSVDCCVNPLLGCNYWNYLYGVSGSIQDILLHFAAISNNGFYGIFSITDIQTRLSNNRLFVIRWGWTTGGGHFLVGHGIDGTDLYYMDPWYGEGLSIASYSWVVSGGSHTWTHTEDLNTPSSRPYPAGTVTGPTSVNQGQTGISYSIPAIINATSYIWTISPASAGTIVGSGSTVNVNLSASFTGIFTINVHGQNNCGNGAISDDLSVIVYSMPEYITITSPDGGENWVQGSSQTITWTDNISENVKLTLFKNGAYHTLIIGSTPSDGSHTWTVPSDQVPGSDYKVKITSTINTSIYDLSNSNFTISSSVPTNNNLQNINVGNGQDNCYDATQTITLAGGGTYFSVQNGGNATLIAGQNIRFLSGTHIHAGGTMHAYITTTGQYCSSISNPLVANTVLSDDWIENQFPNTNKDQFFKVFPNPTTGSFRLELHGITEISPIEVAIFNILGEMVLKETLITEKHCEFSLSAKPAGIYVIRVISRERMEIAKIIKH